MRSRDQKSWNGRNCLVCHKKNRYSFKEIRDYAHYTDKGSLIIFDHFVSYTHNYTWIFVNKLAVAVVK